MRCALFLAFLASCQDVPIPVCADPNFRCDAMSDGLICAESDGSACEAPDESNAWKCVALAASSEGIFWCESIQACLSSVVIGDDSCPVEAR